MGGFTVLIAGSMAAALAARTLTQGKIFAELRDDLKVLKCGYCTTHWTGAIMAVILYGFHLSTIVYWLAFTCGGVLILRLFKLMELESSIKELKSLSRDLENRQGAR